MWEYIVLAFLTGLIVGLSIGYRRGSKRMRKKYHTRITSLMRSYGPKKEIQLM